MIQRGVLLGGALTLAAAAAAQPAAPKAADPLAGIWQIETGAFYSDCRIRGAMTITPTRYPRSYTCRFATRQICPGERDATAEQVCTLARAGDRITITSELVRTNAPGYLADHWRLTFESPTRMSGALLVDRPPRNPPGKPGHIATATFFRKETPIS